MSTPEKVNYIKHLTAFFVQVQKDDRLHANHISLYMSLFQLWNQHHFQTSFPVVREEVLKLCCIGSRATYSRCLKDLEDFNYIIYRAAKHPFMPTMVTITTDFADKPADGVDVVKSEPVTGSESGRFYYKHTNNNKQEREDSHSPSKKSKLKNPSCETDTPGAENGTARAQIPPDLRQVKDFFHAQIYPEQEASKFFYHYQANGWRQGGKTFITDWCAAAHKWILNIHQLKPGSNDHYTKPSNGAGKLHINENKSYSEPL